MPNFVLQRGARHKALQLALKLLESLDEMVSWKVTIEPVKNTRSASQNAYLWAVPNKMISGATGYETEEVHEYLCGTYWGWKDKKVPKTPRNPEGIESVPMRTTTTDTEGKRSVLTSTEFSEYVAFVQRFAAQRLQLLVPDPDPLYELNRERAA